MWKIQRQVDRHPTRRGTSGTAIDCDTSTLEDNGEFFSLDFMVSCWQRPKKVSCFGSLFKYDEPLVHRSWYWIGNLWFRSKAVLNFLGLYLFNSYWSTPTWFLSLVALSLVTRIRLHQVHWSLIGLTELHRIVLYRVEFSCSLVYN